MMELQCSLCSRAHTHTRTYVPQARTASIVAKTNITVWALSRKTFLKFVMKHAQGARALRFLRKLPLLKGLGDQDLIHAGSCAQQIFGGVRFL